MAMAMATPPPRHHQSSYEVRVGTWNCNGKWFGHARNFIELQMIKEKLDIIMVQETRTEAIRSFSVKDFSYT